MSCYVFRCTRWNIKAHLACIEHITGIVGGPDTNRKQAEAITKSKSQLATNLMLTFGIKGEQGLLSISAHVSLQNADISTCMKTPPKRKEQRVASGCCSTQWELNWNSNCEITNLTEMRSFFSLPPSVYSKLKSNTNNWQLAFQTVRC